MSIEGVEEVRLEKNVTGFRNLRSFEQIEIFTQIRPHSNRPIDARQSAERICAPSRKVGSGIRVGQPSGIESRIGYRVEVPARPCAAIKRLSATGSKRMQSA